MYSCNLLSPVLFDVVVVVVVVTLGVSLQHYSLDSCTTFRWVEFLNWLLKLEV